MMQRVRVQVERIRAYAGDATFEVFGDLGTGVVDFDRPLTPRPVRLWPEAERRAGHVLDGHLVVRHLDAINPDGHVEGEHLGAEHLYPAAVVAYETPGYVFGRFQHAVRMVDGAGNVSPSAFAIVTVNSAPTVPLGVTRSGYDAVTDQVSFAFVPSRFDPVAGK